MLTRRALLPAALAAAAAWRGHGAPAALAQAGASAPAGEETLKARAARRGLFYGCAVSRRALETDPVYAAAVAREAASLTPEWEMKWGTVEKRRGEPRYDEADAIAAFAARHGLALHGHTPVWYRNMPPWAPEAIRAGEAEALLRGVVSGMVGRYRGRARSWDVVNEALEPKEGRPDRLRRNPWLDALGPDYLDLAYRVAREADPDAMLVYNDYWFDFDDRTARDRRAAALRLLEDFRKRGTPVDALGIQAHLIAGGPVFREAPMRRFLAQVAAMGYKILITELDVRDTPLPPDIALRDQAVADLATRYLDVVLDERAVAGVITWGLSDKYTWLNDQAQFPRQARADRGVNRALPLDVDMNRKPLWTAIARAFDAAPARPRAFAERSGAEPARGGTGNGRGAAPRGP